MIVATAPASSANLGPGFDALAMALAIDATVGTVDDESLPDRAVVVDEHHPAAVAFARGGGVGDIWMRSSIPMARGLGFSGAVRAAALVAGLAQGRPEATIAELRDDALAPGAELEG
nr:homoserine kinase [Acidimicrobiia bacterium]